MKQIYIRRKKRQRRSKLLPFMLWSTAILALILLFAHLYLIDILHLRSKLAKEEKQPEFIEITQLPVPKEKETKPPKVTKRLAERSRDVKEETTKDNVTKQFAATPPVPASKSQAVSKPQQQPKKVEKKQEEKSKKQFSKSDLVTKKEVASLPEKQQKKETNENKNITAEQLLSEALVQNLPQNNNPDNLVGAPNVKKREATVNLSTTEYKFISYFGKIQRQIYSVWNYPKESQYRGEHGTLFLVFRIRSDGYLEGVQILSSSGYARLDNEAVRAINVAAPYPPFPKSWNLDILNVRATFEYSGRRIF